MKIAFDATGILGPGSKNRGIGNYSTGQFAAMVEQDEENEYFFFNLFEEEFSFKESITEGKNLKEFSLYSGKDYFLLKDLGNDVVRKIIHKFIKENRIDVFYFTSPFDGHMKYQAEWFKDVRTVVLVYDIIPYIFKERYFPDKDTLDWYMGCVEFIRSADRIQVISQSVKDDLVQYLQFLPDKIDVIWGAVDKRYHKMEISTEEKQKLFHKFGIKRSFIMCTGGDDERKNIAGLIEAYSKMNQKIREKYQLVIVCKLSSQAVEKYEKLREDLGCEGQVVLTNFVTDEELLQFYNLASLMAFPSIYEGFGLPVVEAWACGTPVLTSNNSSLVQIAGAGAVLVDPYSIEDIARGLEFALTECDLDNLMEKAAEQLKQFQWERVAQSSIDSINSLNWSQKKEERVSKERRKSLALFFPLPPMQTEDSEEGMRLIAELSKYYDVDVFIDDGYEPDVNLGDKVHILNHNKYRRQSQKYFDTIYQIGNSGAYLYMLPYIWGYSGTVVLNQYNLYELAFNLYLTQDRKEYIKFGKLLSRDYPQQVVDEYISDLKSGGGYGNQVGHMVVNRFVIDYAGKIIVHSNEEKRKLLEKDIGRNVCYIPYMKAEDILLTKEKLSTVAKRYVDFIERQPSVRVDEDDIQYVSKTLAVLDADEEEIDKMSDTLTYLM